MSEQGPVTRLIEAARDILAVGKWHGDGSVSLTLTKGAEDRLLSALAACEGIEEVRKVIPTSGGGMTRRARWEATTPWRDADG